MNLKSFIQLCSWKNFKRIINDYVLSSKDPNSKVVYSIMLGAFMAASPFWGFQAVVTLCFAVLFRLNKVISVTFTSFNVSHLSSFWVIRLVQLCSTSPSFSRSRKWIVQFLGQYWYPTFLAPSFCHWFLLFLWAWFSAFYCTLHGIRIRTFDFSN